jgi:hypothetical protein
VAKLRDICGEEMKALFSFYEYGNYWEYFISDIVIIKGKTT